MSIELRSSNYSSSSDWPEVRNGFWVTMSFVTGYLLVFVVGLVGNLVVATVVFKSVRQKSSSSVKGLFILNLAIADLLIILVCIPPSLSQTIFTWWVLERVICEYSMFFQATSVAVSFYSLVAISTERYLSICHPLRISTLRRRSTAFKIIGTIWIISSTISLPYSQVFRLEGSGVQVLCVESWRFQSAKIIFFVVFLAMYFLAFLAIALSLFFISWRVLRRKIPTDSATSSVQMTEIHRKSNSQILRMLLVMLAMFLVTWLPYVIVLTRLRVVGRPASGTLGENYLFTSLGVTKLLAISNSSIDPIIYSFMNQKFRRELRELFTKRNLWRNNHYEGNSSIKIKFRVGGGNCTNSENAFD